MIEQTINFLAYFAFFAFAGKRLMTYMHVLQQEDYDNGRLWLWIKKNKVFDRKATLGLFILGLIWIAHSYFGEQAWFIPETFTTFGVFVVFAYLSYKEPDPRKSLKKKLVATPRAKRLFFPALAFIMLIAFLSYVMNMPWLWIFNVQMIPHFLMLTNMAVKPVEDLIQISYWNEAKAKLASSDVTIIGVTGSYGKTSVKHILGHILSTKAPTLITPGSVNTIMGITRVIREQLEDHHKYLVVEMGAYGLGSIGRICKLTPPDVAVITSIGHAHFERFKSLDTVAQTKFELAEAAIARDGKVVIHERTLRFPHPRKLKEEHSKNFLICGEPPQINNQNNHDVSYLQKDDMHIVEVVQATKGVDVKVKWQEKVHTFEAPIYGIHHGHNIALVFAAAFELGFTAGDVHTALRSLPQITHRLEVKKQPDGRIIIDDAYNSNPIGFRSALDLLKVIGKSGTERRTIVVTPGMIEMGIAHDPAHQKLGEHAGEAADVVIVVLPERIPTFVAGFQNTGGSKTLVEVDSFKEASKWLEENKTDKDVVLIENDLPDMYERIPKL